MGDGDRGPGEDDGSPTAAGAQSERRAACSQVPVSPRGGRLTHEADQALSRHGGGGGGGGEARGRLTAHQPALTRLLLEPGLPRSGHVGLLSSLTHFTSRFCSNVLFYCTTVSDFTIKIFTFEPPGSNTDLTHECLVSKAGELSRAGAQECLYLAGEAGQQRSRFKGHGIKDLESFVHSTRQVAGSRQSCMGGRWFDQRRASGN